MNIHIFYFALALIGCLFSDAPFAYAQSPSPTPFSVRSIFYDKGEWSEDSVRNEAQAQSTGTPFYKSNSIETRFYEGYFRPYANTSKLAILSDDGTSVWINDSQVLDQAGQNQGFENFQSAFHPLSFQFSTGQDYHVKIQYTNTIHRNDADVDGVSLWAYGGGGEIVRGLKIFKDAVDVTEETISVQAGQKIYLDGGSDVTNAISQPSWEIDWGGKPIGNWVASRSQAYQVNNILRTQRQLNFYWLKPGNEFQVKLTAQVNGRQCSAWVKFNVSKPENSITTRSGRIFAKTFTASPPNYPAITAGNALGYGDISSGSDEGLRFIATFPRGVEGGSVQWVQVIKPANSFIKWYIGQELYVVHMMQASGGRDVPGLDTSYPYPGSVLNPNVYYTDDSPASYNLPAEKNPYERAEYYRMYLMWKPPGPNSIFVPLATIDWGWYAKARYINGVWSLDTGAIQNPLQTPVIASTDDPPGWDWLEDPSGD